MDNRYELVLSAIWYAYQHGFLTDSEADSAEAYLEYTRP